LDEADLDGEHLDPAGWLRVLGLEMESRGRDATGVVAFDDSGAIRVAKAPDRASKFFRAHPKMAEGARTALCHTRARTQGSEKNPLNNHPIRYGPLYGIHNGMVSNDHALFRENKWDRAGEVDSEAIFAAIANLGPKAGLEAVNGSMAVAWVDVSDPHTLHLARGNNSPLHVVTSTVGIFFASTAAALKLIVPDGTIQSFSEGDYVTIRRGKLETIDTFKCGYQYSTVNNSSGKAATTTITSQYGMKAADLKVGERVRIEGTSVVGTVVHIGGEHTIWVEWDPSPISPTRLTNSSAGPSDAPEGTHRQVRDHNRTG
jgi:glucosamine 6-phosphate synthetase-like amidotransferase/phosphosugar isomerase protein